MEFGTNLWTRCAWKLMSRMCTHWPLLFGNESTTNLQITNFHIFVLHLYLFMCSINEPFLSLYKFVFINSFGIYFCEKVRSVQSCFRVFVDILYVWSDTISRTIWNIFSSSFTIFWVRTREAFTDPYFLPASQK